MTDRLIQQTNQKSMEHVFDMDMLEIFYKFELANNARFNSSFTLIFFQIHPNSELYKKYGNGEIDASEHEEISKFFLRQLRDTDLIFDLEQSNKWVILLPHAGKIEAKYCLRRLFTSFQEQYEEELIASVVEIRNSSTTCHDAIKAGENCLSQMSDLEPFEVLYSSRFLERDSEKVRVSILEADDIMLNILTNTLNRMVVDSVELDIRTFKDGNEFLTSDWHTTSHTHLIVMNDVLAKVNGIEVLHQLEKMPNNQKFIIVMMSKRNTVEDRIYVYEHGVDEYITKPFDIRLFEARIKKSLKRARL